jgi:long-chain acyl-CoA synthetase
MQEGSKVAVISKNKPHFIFTLYALFYLKALPVSIDINHNDAVIGRLLDGLSFLITDRRIAGFKGKMISFSALNKNLSSFRLREDDFTRIVNRLPRAVSLDDPFVILCSSGTTGNPKKVILSEKNILWADEEYARLYDFKKNSSIAFVVPAHYSLGILACGIIPFFHGKTILIADGQRIKQSLELICKHKINILPATPTIYNLMNRVRLDKYDFSGLRLCDSGGQILPVAVIKKFADGSGVTITEGYGLTETSSLTHFLVPDKKNNLRLGSMGRPCKSVQCRIVNEAGKAVGAAVPGELLVRGPQNMFGYDLPHNSSDILTADGWLRTGDIVYKDEDEFYYLVSRKIDLCENEFAKASPMRNIEEALYALDAVKECATVITKQGLIIVFVTPSRRNANLEDLKAFLQKKLPSLKNEIEVKFVDSIPRTSTHKVKRSILRSNC